MEQSVSKTPRKTHKRRDRPSAGRERHRNLAGVPLPPGLWRDTREPPNRARRPQPPAGRELRGSGESPSALPEAPERPQSGSSPAPAPQGGPAKWRPPSRAPPPHWPRLRGSAKKPLREWRPRCRRHGNHPALAPYWPSGARSPGNRPARRGVVVKGRLRGGGGQGDPVRYCRAPPPPASRRSPEPRPAFPSRDVRQR